MTDKKTPAVIGRPQTADLYEYHCNNCGDRFWIPPPDADEIECPTCKKMTPLIVVSTACREIDVETICNCDDFKKALEPGTDREGIYAAIQPHFKEKTYYAIGDIPLNFCPWCGKRVPERKEHND